MLEIRNKSHQVANKSEKWNKPENVTLFFFSTTQQFYSNRTHLRQLCVWYSHWMNEITNIPLEATYQRFTLVLFYKNNTIRVCACDSENGVVDFCFNVSFLLTWLAGLLAGLVGWFARFHVCVSTIWMCINCQFFFSLFLTLSLRFERLARAHSQ